MTIDPKEETITKEQAVAAFDSAMSSLDRDGLNFADVRDGFLEEIGAKEKA